MVVLIEMFLAVACGTTVIISEVIYMFKLINFIELTQTMGAYPGLVGLDDGMPVVKSQFFVGVDNGAETGLLFSVRRLRAVSLPLVLLAFLFVFYSIRLGADEGGTGGDMLGSLPIGEEITGDDTRKQPAQGCDEGRLGGRRTVGETVLNAEGDNGRDKMAGEVNKSSHGSGGWFANALIMALLVLCVNEFYIIKIIEKNKLIRLQDKAIKKQDEVIEIYKRRLENQNETKITFTTNTGGGTMEKLKDIIEGLECQLDEILQNTADVDLAATQAEREIRQALERVRRLKDGETLTYEAVEKEEPVI